MSSTPNAWGSNGGDSVVTQVANTRNDARERRASSGASSVSSVQAANFAQNGGFGMRRGGGPGNGVRDYSRRGGFHRPRGQIQRFYNNGNNYFQDGYRYQTQGGVQHTHGYMYNSRSWNGYHRDRLNNGSYRDSQNSPRRTSPVRVRYEEVLEDGNTMHRYRSAGTAPTSSIQQSQYNQGHLNENKQGIFNENLNVSSRDLSANNSHHASPNTSHTNFEKNEQMFQFCYYIQQQQQMMQYCAPGVSSQANGALSQATANDLRRFFEQLQQVQATVQNATLLSNANSSGVGSTPSQQTPTPDSTCANATTFNLNATADSKSEQQSPIGSTLANTQSLTSSGPPMNMHQLVGLYPQILPSIRSNGSTDAPRVDTDVLRAMQQLSTQTIAQQMINFPHLGVLPLDSTQLELFMRSVPTTIANTWTHAQRNNNAHMFTPAQTSTSGTQPSRNSSFSTTQSQSPHIPVSAPTKLVEKFSNPIVDASVLYTATQQTSDLSDSSPDIQIIKADHAIPADPTNGLPKKESYSTILRRGSVAPIDIEKVRGQKKDFPVVEENKARTIDRKNQAASSEDQKSGDAEPNKNSEVSSTTTKKKESAHSSTSSSSSTSSTRPPPPPSTVYSPTGQYEVSKMDVLSENIWHYHNKVSQTETTLSRKLYLRDMLYHSISPVFPMCGLYVVGSSLNGFGNNCSDMDLCLMITNKELDQRTDAVVVLNMILATLQHEKFVQSQQLILAKVPILRIKFAAPFLDITVDLNANNSVAIKNTHLLCYYSSFDWRVRPIVSVVKEWAKRKGINDANRSSFTSYSLVLMVIHYMQCGVEPPVLPNLQKMYPPRFAPKCDVRTLNVTLPLSPAPEDTAWRYNDSATLGELLIGFLDYYANKFDYDRDAISIRQGKRIERQQVARQRGGSQSSSSQSSTHVHGGPNTGPNSVPPSAWRSQWRCICIEEPFTQSNTAHSIYDEMVFNAIKMAFREAHIELEQSRDLQRLLDCTPIAVTTTHGGAVVYAATYDERLSSISSLSAPSAPAAVANAVRNMRQIQNSGYSTNLNKSGEAPQDNSSSSSPPNIDKSSSTASSMSSTPSPPPVENGSLIATQTEDFKSNDVVDNSEKKKETVEIAAPRDVNKSAKKEMNLRKIQHKGPGEDVRVVKNYSPQRKSAK